MPIDEPVREALTKAKRLANQIRSVRAIDFGYRYVNGQRTDDLAVRFHVLRKRPKSKVSRTTLLPRKIESLPTDVVEARYRPHAGNPRSQQARMSPGISVGNLRTGETGTLGCLVRNTAGATFILSNWHVLAGAPEAQVGDEIVQPGPMHAGPNPARPVALLDRSLALTEQLDAALARLGPGVAIDPAVFGLNAPLSGVEEPELGTILVKVGAVSGLTGGFVDGIGGTYQLDYSNFGLDMIWMRGFRLIRPPQSNEPSVSEAGDSGAIWIDRQNGGAVGLHFAGEADESPLNDYALAHPLSEVLRRLAVSLISGTA